MDEYNKLMNEKKNGKIFDFNTITYEELKRLWNDKSFSDNGIANLYNVKKSQVTKKRNDMEINMFNCCWENTMKKLGYLGINSI